MQKLLNKIKLERHNISPILSTTFISWIMSLVSVIAFANLLNPEAFGTYQYILATVTIIGTISLTGVINAIIRAIGKNELHFLGSAKQLILYGSLPAVGISVCVGSYYMYMSNYGFGLSIVLGTICYLATLAQYRFNAMYLALGETKTAYIIPKMHSIAPIVLVVPSLFFTQSAPILATIYFASTLLAFLIGSYWLKMSDREKQLYTNSEPISDYRNRELTNFSVHQSVITLLNTISAHIDKVIVFQILGPQQTALYFIATSIPNRFRSIVKQFETIVFARFAKHNLHAVSSKMFFRFTTALLLIFPLFIIYLFISPWLFSMLLPQYTEAVFLSQIFSITLLAGALIIPQSTLKAHGTTESLYQNAIVFTTIKVLLLTLGAYYYGTIGAILGAVFATVIHVFATLLQAQNIKSTKV